MHITCQSNIRASGSHYLVYQLDSNTINYLLHSIIDVLYWYMVNTHKEQTNSKQNLYKLHDNMMPSVSTAKMAETTVYNAVRATPFTHIHGRPTRNDYETLKKEASDLPREIDNITFDWA